MKSRAFTVVKWTKSVPVRISHRPRVLELRTVAFGAVRNAFEKNCHAPAWLRESHTRAVNPTCSDRTCEGSGRIGVTGPILGACEISGLAEDRIFGAHPRYFSAPKLEERLR